MSIGSPGRGVAVGLAEDAPTTGMNSGTETMAAGDGD